MSANKPTMLLKEFADLNPFNLRQTLIEPEQDCVGAHNLIFHNEVWNKTMRDFLSGLVLHCNVADQPKLPKSCHIQALPRYSKSPPQNREPYVVDIANLMGAFIACQFGTRVYPDIGPAPETGVEERLIQYSLSFTTAVREVLNECGITESSTFSSMSRKLSDTVRYLIVQTNDAAQKFMLENTKYNYAILARMLDELYDKMYDITMPMHVRRECARQLVNYRSKLQDEDLQRYDVDRAARRYHLVVEPNDP